MPLPAGGSAARRWTSTLLGLKLPAHHITQPSRWPRWGLPRQTLALLELAPANSAQQHAHAGVCPGDRSLPDLRNSFRGLAPTCDNARVHLACCSWPCLVVAIAILPTCSFQCHCKTAAPDSGRAVGKGQCQRRPCCCGQCKNMRGAAHVMLACAVAAYVASGSGSDNFLCALGSRTCDCGMNYGKDGFSCVYAVCKTTRANAHVIPAATPRFDCSPAARCRDAWAH